MVLLLGGGGYIGQALARALACRGFDFQAPTHAELDATRPEAVREAVRALRPRWVINAIGYTGRPNVDATEKEKWRCLLANTVVPGVLADVLENENIPWGHVSSGCIFDGRRPDGHPWTEDDPPLFAWADARAGWYARAKAMAEALLAGAPGCLIWRMRIPFDEYDHPRNYLTKILNYEKLLETRGSISHRGEFAEAAVESLARGLPPGIYNLTNPGEVSTSEIARLLRQAGLARREFRYFENLEEFLSAPGRVYRASCTLSSEKALAAGLRLTEVHEALRRTIQSWQPANFPS